MLCEWMRSAKHSPRDPYRVFERRHGLAEIVERRTVFHVERLGANPPQPERDLVISECALRHGQRFAQQCFGFFEAPQVSK